MNTIKPQMLVVTPKVVNAKRLLCLAAWVALTHTVPLGAQNLWLGEHAVLPGGQVDVPLVVSNANGLASAAMVINYDPDILSVEGLTNGGFGEAFAVASSVSEGRIRVAAAREDGLAGGGALVILKFRANAGAVPGLASPITLADRALGGQHGRDFAWSESVTHSNGSVRIVSAAHDSNQNGLPDWWEETYFGGPTNASPQADADGDGMTNLQEFLAGTNPLSAPSALRIESVKKTQSRLGIAFRSVAGKTYRLECSENLSAWQALPPDLTGTGEVIQLTLDALPGVAARFFRLAVVP